MKSAIELHDSEVVAVTIVDNAAIVKLSPAYLHKAAETPGCGEGEGWLLDAEIVLTDAEIIPNETLSGEIWDGSLQCGARVIDNVIDIPLSFAGKCALSLEFRSGQKILISGSSVHVRDCGNKRYLERVSLTS